MTIKMIRIKINMLCSLSFSSTFYWIIHSAFLYVLSKSVSHKQVREEKCYCSLYLVWTSVTLQYLALFRSASRESSSDNWVFMAPASVYTEASCCCCHWMQCRWGWRIFIAPQLQCQSQGAALWWPRLWGIQRQTRDWGAVCWTLELETNLRRSFHIHGEGPS